VCRARRAVVLIYQGKAEMLENGAGFIHTVSDSFELPSVIRIAHMVKRPYRQKKLTRYEIFNRDKYTCQYCGKEIKQLTLDHVIPRYRDGQHTWENVARKPSYPGDNVFFSIPYHYRQARHEWHKYLPQ